MHQLVFWDFWHTLIPFNRSVQNSTVFKCTCTKNCANWFRHLKMWAVKHSGPIFRLTPYLYISFIWVESYAAVVFVCLQQWRLTMPLQIPTVIWLQICGRKRCLSSLHTRSSPTSWLSVQHEALLLNVQQNPGRTRLSTVAGSGRIGLLLAEHSSVKLVIVVTQSEINGKLFNADRLTDYLFVFCNTFSIILCNIK